MSDDDRMLGEYVLLEVIGRGRRSTVHRARRRDRAGRIVAVKHLHADVTEDSVGRLRRNSATLAALGHPAIAPLLDIVDGPDGTIALVSPYAAGGSLQDVLEGRGHMPWWRVADLGARLASGLSAAHDAGVLHGDIAPANVLLGAQDAPRLADFGTAALRADARDGRGGDAAHAAGSVAPEVAAGGHVSVRSDIYSLGAVLDLALAGRPDVPVALVAAVERAVARRPADRFESARLLQEALEPFASHDESTQPLGPPGRSRPAWAWPALAGVAVVSLVVFTGLWMSGRGDAPPPSTSVTSAEVVEPRPRQPAPRCTGVVAPEGAEQVLDADVDGRGCTLPVVVTEELVDGEPTLVMIVPADAGALAGRYALGEAGDRVVVGDWDCDGTDTPAVVRTLDGSVFLFDGYGELAPTRAPALPAGVEPEVVTDQAGCDHVTG